MINPTSARGDLASLITTAIRDSGLLQSAASSHESRVPLRWSTVPTEAISEGGSLDDCKSGVSSVGSLSMSLPYDTRSARASDAPGRATGFTFQLSMTLVSIMRSRPSRSITVQISPTMKGARKPKREYKPPPTGGPMTSLRVVCEKQNRFNRTHLADPRERPIIAKPI